MNGDLLYGSLSSIEIIAAIFAIISLTKLLSISVNKKTWFNYVVRPLYQNAILSSIILAVIAITIFYFLIQYLSITEIIASLAFSITLIGLGFMSYSKEMSPLFEKIYNKKFSIWQWIYILIWIILSLWVIYEIFIYDTFLV